MVFESEEKKTYCKMIKYRKNIQRMLQVNEDKRRQTKTSVLGEEF